MLKEDNKKMSNQGHKLREKLIKFKIYIRKRNKSLRLILIQEEVRRSMMNLNNKYMIQALTTKNILIKNKKIYEILYKIFMNSDAKYFEM